MFWPPIVRTETLCSVALAILLILAAEYAVRTQLVSAMILAAPSTVWNVLVDGFIDGYYVQNTLSTFQSLSAGFLIALVLAIAVAGVLASSQFLERVFTPFIVAFQSLPKVAVAPLVVLALGFGNMSKITIVVIVCFFPMMVNTIQGLKVRDRDHSELFASLGASRLQLFFRLRLPHAVPYIFAGIRVGVIFALIGTVVAEFVGTNSGLGYALLQSKAQFDVAGVYACLVLLMLIGLLVNAVTSHVEQRLSYWISDHSRSVD